MLGKGKLLFVMLFIFSMLFTVVNYLPIIEEESPSQRIELCKKNQEDGGGNNDGNESDEDCEGEFLLMYSSTISLFEISVNYSKLEVIPCREFDRSHIKPPPRA